MTWQREAARKQLKRARKTMRKGRALKTLRCPACGLDCGNVEAFNLHREAGCAGE